MSLGFKVFVITALIAIWGCTFVIAWGIDDLRIRMDRHFDQLQHE